MLEIPLDCVPRTGRGRISARDALARIAERDPRAAAQLLLAEHRPAGSGAISSPPH